MEVLDIINTWFWNEYIWLPKNVTWDMLADTSSYNYCQSVDLYYAFPVAIVLIAIRYFLEKYLFTPFGCYLGLKPNVQREPGNHLLEKAFCENGKIGYKQIQGLAKQLDWSEREVERWIRKRVARSKPSTLNKFTETAWRCTFYSCSFSYGLYVLWDKPWLTTTDPCFDNFPHHDFIQMFVHHIIALMLLSFSWTCNLFRIGSLVLILCDCADIPVEAMKLSKYVGHQRLADFFFTVFTVVWIITHLGLYPYRILYYSLYHGLNFVNMCPAYIVFNVLLSALMVLHIFWSWIIVKMIIGAFFSETPGVKDLLSESEESISSSSERETVENSSQEKNGRGS